MDKNLIQNKQQEKSLKSLKKRKVCELNSHQLGSVAKAESSKITFTFCKRIGSGVQY